MPSGAFLLSKFIQADCQCISDFAHIWPRKIFHLPRL
nr:MAG TPA: hypothetical protein [Caudoviricetes sp.]